MKIVKKKVQINLFSPLGNNSHFWENPLVSLNIHKRENSK